MEELKPCPFCNSKEINLYSIPITANGRMAKDYTIRCDNCRASSGSCINSMDAAIEAWNRRAVDD